MKKVTQSDSKNIDGYDNFEDDYESIMAKPRDTLSRKGNTNQNNDRQNTYGNNFNPRINQHYEAQTGGNYYDTRLNDRRDSNPYQFTYNDNNNNFNNRNNFYGSRNNNDGRRNDSNDSTLVERDWACILQCFFHELKMVGILLRSSNESTLKVDVQMVDVNLRIYKCYTGFVRAFQKLCYSVNFYISRKPIAIIILFRSAFFFYLLQSHSPFRFLNYISMFLCTQTNNEGFPDKNKALHILTKELRDRELKDFYSDSIQECFRMMDVDLKLYRDNCLFSKTLTTCLAQRAEENCADWSEETLVF